MLSLLDRCWLLAWSVIFVMITPTWGWRWCVASILYSGHFLLQAHTQIIATIVVTMQHGRRMMMTATAMVTPIIPSFDIVGSLALAQISSLPSPQSLTPLQRDVSDMHLELLQWKFSVPLHKATTCTTAVNNIQEYMARLIAIYKASTTSNWKA